MKAASPICLIRKQKKVKHNETQGKQNLSYSTVNQVILVNYMHMP